MIQIPERIKSFNFVLINPEGDGKNPLEKAWQKKEHRHDDKMLLQHLGKDLNYGVRGGRSSSIVIDGKSYFLVVVDFDKKQLQEVIMPKLPETFTTTSGSSKQCYHLWFASDNDQSFKIMDENRETLCDVIGEGKQLIAPNSKHKSGSTYSIVKDIPFAFISYSELKALLLPHDKSPKKPVKEKPVAVPKNMKDDFADKLVSSMSMSSVLSALGVDTTKNPTNCPLHSSNHGKCLSWNDETAHCFHCQSDHEGWNKFSLVREARKLNSKETYEWFADKTNMMDELLKSRQEYKNKNKINNNNDVNVNKNTTTPSLPTTSYYIKSWGYFDREKKIHIEQITPFSYIYNYDGKMGMSSPQSELDEKGKVKSLYLEIEGEAFILPKRIYEARLFYNVPSQESCQKFLSGEFKPREYNLIAEDIKKILEQLFDFNDGVDIEVSNIHIGQSWIKPLLNNFFFYMIDSSLGGGKTTLGEIIFFMSRHGFVGGNISSASIPRLTNELDLNIFVDEIDQNLRDDDVLAILRKGQRRGNPYVRCEGRDNVPMAYDLAGCHGGSFRSELEDAFMNRALRLHTKKSGDHMLPVINSAKKEILKPLADELFFWHLKNLVSSCSKKNNSQNLPTTSLSSCSKVYEGVGVFSDKQRKEIYEILTKHLTKDEKDFLTQVFGRDNELTFLCLETAKILNIDILQQLKTIMSNKTRDEASSESFYLDALRQLIFTSLPKLVTKTLKDGQNLGWFFYPKNRLYQDFMSYLKDMNVQTIGTKKFSSLLRDLGFVEGENILSQRYDAYPTACLIFNQKICQNLSIPFKPNKVVTL